VVRRGVEGLAFAEDLKVFFRDFLEYVGFHVDLGMGAGRRLGHFESWRGGARGDLDLYCRQHS